MNKSDNDDLISIARIGNGVEEHMYQHFLFDMTRKKAVFCWYIPGEVPILETFLDGKLVIGKILFSIDSTSIFDVVLSEEFQSEMGVFGPAVIVSVRYVKG